MDKSHLWAILVFVVVLRICESMYLCVSHHAKVPLEAIVPVQSSLGREAKSFHALLYTSPPHHYPSHLFVFLFFCWLSSWLRLYLPDCILVMISPVEIMTMAITTQKFQFEAVLALTFLRCEGPWPNHIVHDMRVGILSFHIIVTSPYHQFTLSLSHFLSSQ